MRELAENVRKDFFDAGRDLFWGEGPLCFFAAGRGRRGAFRLLRILLSGRRGIREEGVVVGG